MRAAFKKLLGTYLIGTAVFVATWFVINPFFGASGAWDAANWRKTLAWHRKAAEAGRHHRDFCAYLADVFDSQAPCGARYRLWKLIDQTPNLDWLLLAKRPANIVRMLPSAFDLPEWGDGWPNVWLGVSAEDQENYNHRWPILDSIPAAVKFVSYEQALGPLTLMGHDTVPGWLIWGGERGPGAR